MQTPVKNKEMVLARIFEAKQKLAALGVNSVGLFGSFARGEETDASDVDFLVEFAPEQHSFDNFMDVSFFLEELLGRKVEVITPDALSPHIGPYILREVERVRIAA